MSYWRALLTSGVVPKMKTKSSNLLVHVSKKIFLAFSEPQVAFLLLLEILALVASAPTLKPHFCPEQLDVLFRVGFALSPSLLVYAYWFSC